MNASATLHGSYVKLDGSTVQCAPALVLTGVGTIRFAVRFTNQPALAPPSRCESITVKSATFARSGSSVGFPYPGKYNSLAFGARNAVATFALIAASFERCSSTPADGENSPPKPPSRSPRNP